MTSKLQVNAIKNALSATDNITLGSDGSVTLQTGAALGSNTLAASGGSSLVGYLPAGTGAVTTDVQSKLREFVSVKDFMTAAQIADVQSGSASMDVTALKTLPEFADAQDC